MVRPLFMPCPPSWPSMARHQIEIQIDFSRFGSQRRHIQDIAAVPKKLNRTLVVNDPSPHKASESVWATDPILGYSVPPRNSKMSRLGSSSSLLETTLLRVVISSFILSSGSTRI